ncbi:MAG: hypothetical protein C0506_03205 [Anaerolinea sp.]|nr:hypothetical protein [Anaerolinea sp.]
MQMEPHISHPLDRMKPQRGREWDRAAPPLMVAAPPARHIRWRLVAFATVASALAGAASAVAAQAF